MEQDAQVDCKEYTCNVEGGLVRILRYGEDRDPAIRMTQIEWSAGSGILKDFPPATPASKGAVTIPEWVLSALLVSDASLLQGGGSTPE